MICMSIGRVLLHTHPLGRVSSHQMEDFVATDGVTMKVHIKSMPKIAVVQVS